MVFDTVLDLAVLLSAFDRPRDFDFDAVTDSIESWLSPADNVAERGWELRWDASLSAVSGCGGNCDPGPGSG